MNPSNLRSQKSPQGILRLNIDTDDKIQTNATVNLFDLSTDIILPYSSEIFTKINRRENLECPLYVMREEKQTQKLSP